MNYYLDTSALVKRYVWERGSEIMRSVWHPDAILLTAHITRVEMMATFAKAVRMGVMDEPSALLGIDAFKRDWVKLAWVPLHEDALDLAGDYAWRFGLRGYDAVHLASAMIGQHLLQAPVVFATFDRKLWQAAADAGLHPFPNDLTPFLVS